jgi:hypothetical protein
MITEAPCALNGPGGAQRRRVAAPLAGIESHDARNGDGR